MTLKKIRVSRKPKPYVAYEVTIKNLPLIEKELGLSGYDVSYENGKPISVRFQNPNDRSSHFVAHFGETHIRLIGIDERGELQVFTRELAEDEFDFEVL